MITVPAILSWFLLPPSIGELSSKNPEDGRAGILTPEHFVLHTFFSKNDLGFLIFFRLAICMTAALVGGVNQFSAVLRKCRVMCNS